MLSHSYNITFDCSVSAQVHCREVLYDLNDTEKRFLLQMMETVQLARTKVFDTQINIHSLIHNSYVSLAQ